MPQGKLPPLPPIGADTTHFNELPPLPAIGEDTTHLSQPDYQPSDTGYSAGQTLPRAISDNPTDNKPSWLAQQVQNIKDSGLADTQNLLLGMLSGGAGSIRGAISPVANKIAQTAVPAGFTAMGLINAASNPSQPLPGLLQAAMGALGTGAAVRGMRNIPSNLAQQAIKEEPNWQPVGQPMARPQESIIKAPQEPIQEPLPITKPQPTLSPIDKLKTAIENSKPLNEEQRAIYSKERAEKLAKMSNVTTGGEAGYHEQLGALAGKHTKVSIEPLRGQLGQEDVDQLMNAIGAHPATIGFEEIHAKTALAKLLDGQVPTRSETATLGKVFGPEFQDSMMRSLPEGGKTKSMVAELVNLPRALMASTDFSAPFRQGLGLVHKKEFWTSFNDMFKSFGSEEGLKAVQQSIEQKPTFPLMREAKLSLTDLGNLSNREESFMSNMAERVPVLGRVVRASNRAYVGFLNKLRADTFDSLIKSAQDNGLSPELNLPLARDLAKFVNTATGRGSLWKLEHAAVGLNETFFSPRLIASRLKMLNPNTYVQLGNQYGVGSPQAAMIRKEYLKSLFAIAGAGATVTALGKLAGGEVESDPTSSDFGKVKIGNTRLDPYGGYQQYLVAASRLISGEQKLSTTGNKYELGSKYGLPTRLDVAERFGESKLTPALSFVTTVLRGKDMSGQPVQVPNEVASRFVPMMLQDIMDIAKDNPGLLPLAIPGAFGMGLQTYGQGQEGALKSIFGG